MLEVKNLTKRYGRKTAVDDISFTVKNGRVTGFLGPNGAGKSTTMRMLLGLEKPSKGQALIDGRKYTGLSAPLTAVGSLLDAKALHPKRSAKAHLMSLALTHGISKERVNEVIDLTGLGAVAKKPVKGFSLGMGQRLGIATALLADPQNIILDEPVNGLDPEGVIWVRNLAKYLASEGKSVLISSHLMSEMEQTADDLIVIGRGKVLANCSMGDFLHMRGESTVLVRTTRRDELAGLVAERGYAFTPQETDALMIAGAEAREIAEIAYSAGIFVYELTQKIATLEEVYLEMTGDAVEYNSAQLKRAVQAPAKESGEPALTGGEAAGDYQTGAVVDSEQGVPQAAAATMYEDETK